MQECEDGSAHVSAGQCAYPVVSNAPEGARCSRGGMITRVCAATSQDSRAKVGAIAAVLRPGLSALEVRRLPLPDEPLVVHAVLLALALAARHKATHVDVLLSEPFVAQKLRAGRSMTFPSFRPVTRAGKRWSR